MSEEVVQPPVETLEDKTKSVAITPEIVAELKKQSLESFYFFAKGILGFDWLQPHIHLPICQILEDYEKQTRVRIVLPRSWLKSTLCTIAYPIWRACKNPNIRVLIVQNTVTNSKKKLSVIRAKFETCGLFRLVFQDLMPGVNEIWSTEALSVPHTASNAEATFEVAGTRTKLTSRHYDLIIEDDTVAPDLDDMSSGVVLPAKEDIEQAIGFHLNTLPLLVDVMTSQILMVGTRWFERDLISWSQEHEKHYTHYQRAVKETSGIADEEGTCTYPERFPQEALNQLKIMGDYLYNCLYMNNPTALEGMVFKNEWFRHYDTAPRDIIVYTTIDLASPPEECKGDPDFNVVMTVGKDLSSGRLYVLDYFRERCTPSVLIQALFTHVRMYGPVKVGIESVAYQRAMITWVKERMRKDNLYFMVEPITHGKKSKLTRIKGLEPFYKAGMVFHRKSHRILESELLQVSHDRGIIAANDDVMDALSSQIPMWAITRLAEDSKDEEALNDPFTFDSAELEIASRPRSLERHAWSNLN